MNIFYLDHDPCIAARMLCDKHIHKMPVESAQLLSNIFDLEQLNDAPKTQKCMPRKHSYPHHPCSKWVQESKENSLWLIEHALSMLSERLFRFPNRSEHFSKEFIIWAKHNIYQANFVSQGFSEPPKAMKDYWELFGNLPTVEAYRGFYIADKKRFATWTRRAKPDWWVSV